MSLELYGRIAELEQQVADLTAEKKDLVCKLVDTGNELYKMATVNEVRDKVRKMWCAYVTLPLGTGDYNKIIYMYQGKRHTVYLKRHISDARDAPCFSADTEPAAWQAALLWLAEQETESRSLG